MDKFYKKATLTSNAGMNPSLAELPGYQGSSDITEEQENKQDSGKIT
jgi:hypothetical protein